MADKADAPIWDGQELYMFQGIPVFLEEIPDQGKEARLIEFPGGSSRDIYIVSYGDYFLLRSATPKNLEPYI